MITCKACGSERFVKNGVVRGLQRYRCKDCGCNFTDTPARGRSEASKALAVLMYSMGKSSYRFIGKLLNVSAVSVYKWIRAAAANIPEPEPSAEVREMELDEMWHFLHSKKANFGSGKPMIVASGNVSPGLWVAVILQRFDDYGNASPALDAPITPITGTVTPK